MGSLLLATIFLPLAGAILAGTGGARARQSALMTTVLTLALAGILVAGYPSGGERPFDETGTFAETIVSWLGGADGPIHLQFRVGLDGLSLWLFALTALLMVVAVLVSWEAIDRWPGAYYALLLLLETGMLGVFVARDIILFYVFFEFTLIPLFFLIGIWGSDQRRYAAVKFFLFTLAGSVLTLLGLLAIVLWDHSQAPSRPMTFSISELTANLAARPMEPWMQIAVFLLLLAGFAVKVPLFPLHTWLPLAHVEAPTAGSVLLAGVLLKVGTYGLVRFALPMTPEGVAACMPWLLWLSVIGIVYGSMVALAQSDIKRLIAYSSVAHLGFCTLGMFALNPLGLRGSVLQMVNHGLSTGGLFAVVGMLYERYHSRQIKDFGGLARQTPRLAAFMVVLTLASIGLPGLNGFVGEFLILLGMFQRSYAAPEGLVTQYRVIAVLGVAGVVLGAWYMLGLVQKVFFGPLRTPGHVGDKHAAAPVQDLCLREVLALAPLVVFIVWIGVWPQFFMARMSPTLDRLTAPAMDAADRQAEACPGAGAQGPRDLADGWHGHLARAWGAALARRQCHPTRPRSTAYCLLSTALSPLPPRRTDP